MSYLHSFSTPSHHCLVLEHVGGGELFDLIDSAESHAKLDEPLLRRMFGELCKAVGWMHGVGLVHRDFGDEVVRTLFVGDVPINLARALHGQKIFARDARYLIAPALKRRFDARDVQRADEFGMARHEGVHFA